MISRIGAEEIEVPCLLNSRLDFRGLARRSCRSTRLVRSLLFSLKKKREEEKKLSSVVRILYRFESLVELSGPVFLEAFYHRSYEAIFVLVHILIHSERRKKRYFYGGVL